MELQIIQSKIFEIRGKRVMLDFHLAEMYEVETRTLKQAVKRNLKRFPDDFMFSLTENEAKEVLQIGVSQFVIPPGYNFGGTTPMAFTEQGVSMLSAILKSKKAIDVSISIIRAFVTLRQFTSEFAELNQKLENFMLETNMQFNDIFQALTELASSEEEQKQLDKRRRIGFKN